MMTNMQIGNYYRKYVIFRRFTDYKLDHIKIENCFAKIKDIIKDITINDNSSIL